MRKFWLMLSIVFIWTCSSSPTKSEPAPQAPTVNNLTITTNEDTPATFTMTGTDPEGAALTFSVSTQPQNGAVTASGAAGTYTPNENFNGTDTFAYIASDGGLSSTAGLVTVTVTAVDDDPNTMNVSAITDEDNAVEITLEAEEFDGDTISFNVTDDPTNGTVTITGDKATYTPNENYYGADSFTFEAVDTTAKKVLNTATASLTINPINDAPVVEAQSVEGWNTTDLTLTLSATDVEGDNVSFEIVDNPTNISASIDGSTLTINKSSSFWGADSLTYYAYDGTEYGNTAKVDITFKRYINYNRSSYALRNNELYIDFSLIGSALQIFEYQYGAAISYGDFNSDGYIDFVVSTSRSYPGANGPGQRAPVGLFINDGDNANFTQKDDELILNNVGTEFGRKTLTGDFNGDNIPDAFFADHAWDGPGGGLGTYQSMIMSKDNGKFDFKVLDNLPIAYAHGASSADIDNDGDLDIFVIGGNFNANYSTGFFFINDGNGNFEVDYSRLDFQETQYYTCELAHVDSDPHIDLIVGGGYAAGSENLKTKIFFGSSGFYSKANMVEIPIVDMNEGEAFFPNDYLIYDLDKDGNKEIISLGGIDPPPGTGNLGKTFIQIVSHNGDFSFVDQTNNFIENNSYQPTMTIGFGRFRMQDIDNDGSINLIRDYYYGHEGHDGPWDWEWNGSKLIPQF